MLLQFCDKCGRPLSEGALARGEAIERGGDTICTLCVEKERLEQVAKARIEAIQANAAQPRPLAQYDTAVWNCVSCGIPINALDLIEGRAARNGHRVECIRCRGAAANEARVAPPVAAHSQPHAPAVPPPHAPVSHVPPKLPLTPPRPVQRAPLRAPASSGRVAADAFVASARKEQSRPVLPIILFAIILPMFAISVWFAIQYQQKLSEMTDKASELSKANNASRERPTDDGARRLPPEDPPVQPPPVEPAKDGTKPDTPVQPEGLPRTIAEDLAQIERDLAAPVLKQLQSRDRTEVWDGLLAAGSRRLIGTRAQVRALLDDADPHTRAIACRVCAMLADNNALRRLEALAESDPSEEVRDAAHLARSRLLGKAARELKDLTPEELDALKRDVEEQIRKANERRDG
ncbi:MAG: HEAT repeat domain-containing protein [Planctomycetes bacterium]|nr:HEAT repeat domain-containing protein [Planctomycetota bacterium]